MATNKIIIALILLIAVSNCSKAPGFDLLQNEIDDYHNLVRQEYGFLEGFDESKPSDQEVFSSVLTNTKWMCTNGKDPNSLTNKQYVKEFAAGPCNPAIVLPGIAGSKLVVQIDCATFKKENPKAFSDCGWSTCGSFLAPKSEYKMWIPETGAPMSISVPFAGQRNCFNAVFGFDDSDVKNGGNLIVRKGLTAVVYGTSPNTRSKQAGGCAWDAISNLGTAGPQTPGTSVFASFLTLYESAGYKNGVNLQALPYDFRLAYQKNELNTRFSKVIKEMYNNWGKKIIIYAHSFGNY
jgi:lecithin-cholesterol acyltransferase